MNSLLHTKQFLLPTTILLCVLLSTALAPVGAQGADCTAETNPLHAAVSDRVSARPELVITTPGFGSCARQNRPQPKKGNSKAPGPKPAVPSKPQPNRHRLHERPCTGANFGPMRVKWDGPNPSIGLEVCGLEGDVDLSREIPFSELRSK